MTRKPPVMLIGLAGKSGAGKDTAADFICSRDGFVRVAIADPIKEATGLIFGLTKDQLWGAGRNVVDPRYEQTPRELYQALGSACRSIHSEVWLRRWREAIVDRLAAGQRVVVPDVRLPGEIYLVHELGGVVWRIERPNARAPGLAGLDVTEMALDASDEMDAVIVNDRTKEQLGQQLTRLLAGRAEQA
jgi:hypothetical protein